MYWGVYISLLLTCCSWSMRPDTYRKLTFFDSFFIQEWCSYFAKWLHHISGFRGFAPDPECKTRDIEDISTFTHSHLACANDCVLENTAQVREALLYRVISREKEGLYTKIRFFVIYENFFWPPRNVFMVNWPQFCGQVTSLLSRKKVGSVSATIHPDRG